MQRVTFDGSYNVTPRLSPDGKTLAFVQRNAGRFQVAVMDLASRQTQVLTDGKRDESPSFAPNGKMILYATEVGGRGVLAAISSDGRVKQRLSVAGRGRPRAGVGPGPRQLRRSQNHETNPCNRGAGRVRGRVFEHP